MDSTGGAVVGIAAIGLGALVGYGAYKNAPVFGPSGLLTSAIKTGKLQKVVPGSAGVSGSSGAGGSGGSPPNAFLEWTLGVGSKGWFRALTPAGIWTWVFGTGGAPAGKTPPPSLPGTLGHGR